MTWPFAAASRSTSSRLRRGAAAVLLAAALLAPAAVQARAGEPVEPGLKVDRIVLMMRHGVRPPTKNPAMPAGVAAQAWPRWSTPPGNLTAHGATAIGQLARSDHAWFVSLGLAPAQGCPAPGQVSALADSDQRTIATADAWLEAFASGCGLKSTHRPQGEDDPLFSPPTAWGPGFDPAQADAAVAQAAGPGGIEAVEAAQRPLLDRLDAILCGGEPRTNCGVVREPSAIAPARPGARPKLSGALDRASTAAQILLLQYAEGLPMTELGWGRATAEDVTAFSALHALEFRLVARPPYVAARNAAAIAQRIDQALSDPAPGAPAITLFSGHDTNVANLGGLLDIHWRAPGFAADDPVPGGAIVLERLRDTQGRLYVRALYRAQSLEQLRAAGALEQDPPHRAVLPIAGCSALNIGGLCDLATFRARLQALAR